MRSLISFIGPLAIIVGLATSVLVADSARQPYAEEIRHFAELEERHGSSSCVAPAKAYPRRTDVTNLLRCAIRISGIKPE